MEKDGTPEQRNFLASCMRNSKERHKKADSIAYMLIVMVMAGLILLVCMQGRSHAYTLDQWANAIHKAEGNDNYGILSVSCVKGEGCRKICKNTVRNNYKRWKLSKQNIPFLQFLGKRYCPVGASNDHFRRNGFWIENVSYFLNHGG